MSSATPPEMHWSRWGDPVEAGPLPVEPAARVETPAHAQPQAPAPVEYAVRVQHRGKYPTGFAHVECMYAPEFNSHSETINLEVK